VSEAAFPGPLELVRPAACPELRIWVLARHVDLEAACVELAEGEPPPYWAFCWAGGQALARYLLDHPHEVRGRRVVDFGAGGGVAGLAALRAGARELVAVDCDPAARRAVQRNARANGVSVEVAAEIPEDWDVLLAGDVLYEAGNRERLLAQVRAGRRVLVADPERAREHQMGLAPLARIDARTLPDVDPPVKCAAIFALGDASEARSERRAGGAGPSRRRDPQD
jgi:predicted nicotinamide N-methyase